MQTITFAISTTEQEFPADPGIASYRVGLHDAQGREVQGQSTPTPPATATFDVPAGTGWTVRGSQVNAAGALVGTVVESAPFDVQAITRIVIGAIQMIVP